MNKREPEEVHCKIVFKWGAVGRKWWERRAQSCQWTWAPRARPQTGAADGKDLALNPMALGGGRQAGREACYLCGGQRDEDEGGGAAVEGEKWL